MSNFINSKGKKIETIDIENSQSEFININYLLSYIWDNMVKNWNDTTITWDYNSMIEFNNINNNLITFNDFISK
jgi:hypothetical protein